MELSGPRLDPAKGGSARSAVLLLHGYGADGNDLIGLAAEWAPALPETLFFSPHAPYPCEASSFGRQWFGFQDKPRHLVAMEVATAAQVIDSAIDSLLAELSIGPGRLALAGFSQGVAMAFRAACTTALEVKAVIAIGGDVPPEIGASDLGRFPAAFLGRGDNDEWYTSSKMRADEQRLTAAGVSVRALSTPGGHEWTPALTGAVRDFLADVQR